MVPGSSGGGASSCGCKGIRRCLSCETFKGKVPSETTQSKVVHRFVYDSKTGLAVSSAAAAPSFPFPGVFLWEDFVSEEEEGELIASMDRDPWSPSQSGRRKQDFGPKVNFKKRKVRVGNFSGLPPLSRKLILRLQREPSLSGFRPVEQCNLDYHPLRGSGIDPHLDDSWLWGERLVTLNLLSDTVLTMSLEDTDAGPSQEVRVAVRLPRRCLVALRGEARHRWKHAIHREDVHERRVCSTFRELSAEFLHGGNQEELGTQLLRTASSFRGTPA